MATSITSTRTSVLERARDGDASDFARLYAPLAYAIARKFGLREQDAEDVAHDAMVTLLELLPGFEYDRSRGSFKGLIKKIVHSRAVDHLRRRREILQEEPQIRVPEPDDAFEEMCEREWRKALLMLALDRVRTEVEPTTFQSFQLFVLEQWPREQVADTIGLSPNQVSKNKGRVIQRLRAHVKELERESA